MNRSVQSSRRARRAAACVVALAAAASPYCFAEDGKVYPASMCAGSLVGSPPITNYDGRRVVNTSTTNSAVVVCPVVKDNVFAVTGANEGYVRYYKGTTTGFIADLYSFSAFGTANFVQFRSDFGAAGYKTLSYTPIGSYSQGYYSFVVVIPPGPAGAKSSMISYRLDEND
ncbi:MAG: hypothetical protein ABW110_24190 [Steroidobacteraceae bacterium]